MGTLFKTVSRNVPSKSDLLVMSLEAESTTGINKTLARGGPNS